nr:hypothetical protein [Brevundimonas sp. C43]
MPDRQPSDATKPIDIEKRNRLVGPFDQLQAIHLAESSIHMHRRNADQVAEIALGQGHVKDAARRIAAFGQSIEEIGQGGGDANMGGRLTNHSQTFHQRDALLLRAQKERKRNPRIGLECRHQPGP